MSLAKNIYAGIPEHFIELRNLCYNTYLAFGKYVAKNVLNGCRIFISLK